MRSMGQNPTEDEVKRPKDLNWEFINRKTLGLKTCFVNGGVVSAIDIGFFKNLFLFYWSISYFLTFFLLIFTKERCM